MSKKTAKNSNSVWSLPKSEEKTIIKSLKERTGRTPDQIRADSKKSYFDIVRQGAIQGALKAGANQSEANTVGGEAVCLAKKQKNLHQKVDEVSFLHAQVIMNPSLLPYIQAQILLAYAELFSAAASFSYKATRITIKRLWGGFRWRLRAVMKRLNPVLTFMKIIDILKMIIGAIKAVLENLDLGAAGAATA